MWYYLASMSNNSLSHGSEVIKKLFMSKLKQTERLFAYIESLEISTNQSILISVYW